MNIITLFTRQISSLNPPSTLPACR